MFLTARNRPGSGIRASMALVAALGFAVALGGCERSGAEPKEPVRWVKPLPPDKLGVAAPVSPGPAHTPVWVLKTPDGKQLTIFGAFHAIRKGTSWAPPALLDACPDADLVFVEEPDLKPSDIEALKAIAPPGPPWKGLNDAERRRLEDVLKPFALGLKDYQDADAGRMVLQLEGMIAASRGQGGPPAVERWAAVSCARSGQKLRALDPAGTYTRIIMSLPAEASTSMLRSFVAEPDKQPNIQSDLYQAWTRGDMPAIERFARADRARWQAIGVEDAVLKARNERWARAIKASMTDHDRVMVVVGLSHLVGPDSLIERLGAQGLAVPLAPEPSDSPRPPAPPGS